jgi:polygalacturonase
MHFYGCRNTIIHDLVLKNSAQFHIKMDECHTAEIYNLNIKVNTTAQINLLRHFSLEGVVPMFPFNTDGIDPHGSNMHIYNLTVQNWDDVVVPKPGSNTDMFDNCTQNFLVENCTVVLGVGMTNVTFRNVHMKNPLKGIYVKTNPGNDGLGIVSNIVYENFTMLGPKWWAVYIGPQQMKEPDGDGPGCMLYPFDPKGTCTTQPLVTLQNITLRNIAITDSWFYPVTIRCNVSNPCRHFVFENVTTDKWYVGQH